MHSLTHCGSHHHIVQSLCQTNGGCRFTVRCVGNTFTLSFFLLFSPVLQMTRHAWWVCQHNIDSGVCVCVCVCVRVCDATACRCMRAGQVKDPSSANKGALPKFGGTVPAANTVNKRLLCITFNVCVGLRKGQDGLWPFGAQDGRACTIHDQCVHEYLSVSILSRRTGSTAPHGQMPGLRAVCAFVA